MSVCVCVCVSVCLHVCTPLFDTTVGPRPKSHTYHNATTLYMYSHATTAHLKMTAYDTHLCSDFTGHFFIPVALRIFKVSAVLLVSYSEHDLVQIWGCVCEVNETRYASNYVQDNIYLTANIIQDNIYLTANIIRTY